jgi:putative NIF3 family GTP cyclohydrolase 1 type 2
MLDDAREQKFNIYNMHLGWDVMPDGIGDSFLLHFGLAKDEFQKVDLTYSGHKISKLGAIINRQFSIDELVHKLNSMNVFPSVIINPRCSTNKVGYIPGGGFNDEMIIEMADMGVDVLISSDANWVVETVARESGVTLIEIDHYVSERYGLQSMKKLLSREFPSTPVHILENIDNIQCDVEKCECCLE